jgi:hypothetical protein
MLIISICIIIIIIIIETLNNHKNIEKIDKIIKKKKLNKNSFSFLEFTLNDSIEILHKPGYIYTEINDNLFLINDNHVLMKKDFVYDIDSDFKLEYILLKKPIKYFYHKK